MDYTKFIDKLKKDEISGFYIFEGPEEFLAMNTIEMIKHKILNLDTIQFNYTKLIGEDISIKEVVDEINVLPFMSNKRIILINSWKGLSKDLANKYEKLEKYKDSFILILYSCPEYVKKNLSIYKILKKYDRVISFNLVTAKQLELWIKRKIGESGKNITREALDVFIYYLNYGDSSSNNTLQRVNNEIMKLKYLDSDEINEEHISMLINQSVKTNIFNLTDALSDKNKKRACEEYNMLIDIGEEPIKILYMISRHMINILKIKFYRDKHMSDVDIIKKLGMSNFEYKKIASKINKYSYEEATKAIKWCSDADYHIKTSPGNAKSTIFFLINKILS